MTNVKKFYERSALTLEPRFHRDSFPPKKKKRLSFIVEKVKTTKRKSVLSSTSAKRVINVKKTTK